MLTVRDILSCFLVLVALLCLPLRGEAAEKRLLAVISIKDQPRYQSIHEAFVAHLSSDTLQNYRIYVQSPNPDVMSLRNSARKAVAIGADLIVAYGTGAALAAQAESQNTPVIFADVYDPARQGLVTVSGRPKKLATGIRGDAPIQTLLNAFLETTPVKSLAVLYNPKSPAGKLQLAYLEEMGKRKGFVLEALSVPRKKDVPEALKNISPATNGLVVADCSILATALVETIASAHEKKIAVISQIPGSADLGGLMALENDPVEQGRVAAEMVDQVLAGSRVEELLLVKPRNISLTVNLKTAKTLGLTVPFDVLTSTSRVIR